ncbi:MAG: alginate O-acetyltransferase complex protein AlgI [Planctomycetota bacterium]
MLFNSYLFIFVFIPVVLLGFGILAVRAKRPALIWLTLVSLFYYGFWNPTYLGLLAVSVFVNYGIGRTLGRLREPHRRPMLIFGVILNLGLLGYFKYANFAVENMVRAFDFDWSLPPIVLPLAISFFTFQQVAFLVDAYRGETREYNFLDYVLFVTFFPQLIAGPIVHHKEMMPQFARLRLRLRSKNLAIGSSMFVIGLAKKVLLADTMAGFASPVFTATENGLTPDLATAWIGVGAYTCQIYFDFSGYSDMAIGVARLFGIRLPLNFASPYKARSIVEFWRRWHMTLSRFLRDYLYFPLGGNRCGALRRHVNLMLTMLLGGLWHGAGWNFVVWGGLHGSYLVANHLWANMRPEVWSRAKLYRAASRLLTFVAVMVAWVFFRATTFESASLILSGLLGSGQAIEAHLIIDTVDAWGPLLACLAVAFFLPNSQELMSAGASIEGAQKSWAWRPNPLWALGLTGLFFWSVWNISNYSEFIYFQF